MQLSKRAIECETVQPGKNMWVDANTRFVFLQSDTPYIMIAVFDPPMIANRGFGSITAW